MEIVNILYPRRDARDDEIERLDGVVLNEGLAFINGSAYVLESRGPPEYTRTAGRNECGSVTYRWRITPYVRHIDLRN